MSALCARFSFFCCCARRKKKPEPRWGLGFVCLCATEGSTESDGERSELRSLAVCDRRKHQIGGRAQRASFSGCDERKIKSNPLWVTAYCASQNCVRRRKIKSNPLSAGGNNLASMLDQETAPIDFLSDPHALQGIQCRWEGRWP